MRHAPAGVLLLLLFLAAPGGRAQSAGVSYVVKQPGTEVRALASDQPESYVTNRLDKGAAVEVVEEQPGGWLKIRPPAGSTSWISKPLLKSIAPGQPATVYTFEDGEAPVFPSPADATDKLPTVIGARLKRGHQVVLRGKVISNEKVGTWVEIESPQSEARYVRADAVERRAADVLPVGATVPADSRAVRQSSAPSAAVTSAAEEARRAAVAADNSGNYAEAVRLYDRIVEQFGDSHPKLADMSKKRAAYLRGEHNIPPAPPDARPQAKAVSQSTAPVSAGERKVAGDGGSATWEKLTQERTDPNNVRAYRGWLSASYSQPINGRKVYLLTLNPPVTGLSLLYVVAGPGVNLPQLVGKPVELRGPLTYRGDLYSYVMDVRQAAAD
jgi:hypothetical protein